MVKKVVELKVSYNNFSNGDYGIYYLGDGRLTSMVADILEVITEITRLEDEEIEETIIKKYNAKEELEAINEDMLNDSPEAKPYTNIGQYLEDWGLYELLEYIIDCNKLDMFLETLDISFGTVGYSPWSYYMACPSIDHNFINDLYEGWNFYTIVVSDLNGETLDTLGNAYIKDSEDFIYYLKDYIIQEEETIDDYALVKGELTQHVRPDGLKLAQKVYDVKYEIA